MDQFRLQILSDLHLEVERPDEPLYAYDFPVSAPNLALLGDIGWTRDDRLFDWLRAQLARFETVFFVCGNHEPYGVDATVKDSMDRLKSFQQSSSGKLIVLDRTRFDVSPTLTILGCTLWSALDPDCLDILSWSLTDFKRIHGFDAAFYNTLHQTDLAWLCESVEIIRRDEPHRRVVVLTHHAPTIEGTGDPKYIGGPTSSAFATELIEFPCWGSPVHMWAFGHTHWCCDFERKGVRVYANQRGYGTGTTDFDPSKAVLL
ncbi:Ser/Thr protein phosphatase superfamily protein [Armillaria solidipes]|uniref:Ser/Thr protein phosphatase superfamily protein n=1 Tax=Armillaria solidipes TaxID=1076256 RepID=A0A2H3CBM5_9AGAR|nr:Ser/Thr protein phosphatase superfamily protein [Armillaria solidipes]